VGGTEADQAVGVGELPEWLQGPAAERWVGDDPGVVAGDGGQLAVAERGLPVMLDEQLLGDLPEHHRPPVVVQGPDQGGRQGVPPVVSGAQPNLDQAPAGRAVTGR
jgi:hypothetical protein